MPPRKRQVSTVILAGLDECRKAWEEFYTKGDMFSDWEYRACFFDPVRYTLHFILGLDCKKPAFLLPLWVSKEDGIFEFFGGQVP
jgi:hypothetical protein